MPSLPLDENPYFPGEKYGLPETGWLVMRELIYLKVVITSWLEMLPITSLLPRLIEEQMDSLSTARHPDPATMLSSLSKSTL